MKNLRSFTVTHKPVTNTTPSKVRIYDNRFKKVYFASYYDTPLDRQEEIAANWLKSKGINISILSEGKKGFILLTDNFNPIES